MEEPQPRARAQSAMQMRPSTFQIRASKIMQKIRGKINLTSTRSSFGKNERESMEGPYRRQTTSLDVTNVKPYMSQPMLGLDSSSAMDNDGDGDDSSQSITPTHSPSRITGNRDLPTLNTNGTESAIQRTAPHTSPPSVTGSRGFSHPTPSYTSVARIPVDGLPTVHQDKHISIVTITSEPTAHSHSKHVSSNAANSSSTRPRAPTRPTPPLPSVPTMSSPGTPDIKPLSALGRHAHPNPSLSDIPAIRIITPRSSMSKIPAPPLAQESRGLPHQTNAPSASTSTSSSSGTTPPQPSTPTRRPPPLSLSLPLHRFSTSPNNDSRIMSTDAAGRLTFIDGGTARLSPSIITRHPPMPILNLPTLPVFPSTSGASGSSSREASDGGETNHSRASGSGTMTGTGGEHRSETMGNDMRARAARLRSMPALPIRGSSLPQATSSGSREGGETSVEEAYGEGEDDDLEDDDMEGEDEMYVDADADVDPDGSDGEGEDEGVPRPSMSSGISGSSSLEVPGRTGKRSRDRSRSRSKSPLPLTEEQQRNRTLRQNDVNSYGLPQVDTSRLDFSLFNDEPPPVPDKGKGKGKAKAFDEATPMATPKATPSYTHPPYDYFSQNLSSPNTDSAGVRTPRAGDALRTPATAYASPKMMSIPMTMPIPSPSRPGMYKQTSRSMIDILSIAKREKIRQEEEIVQKDVLSKIGGRVLSRKGKASESKLEEGAETEGGLVRVESSSTLTAQVVQDPTAVQPESTPSQRLLAAPPYDMLSNPLRRRRSMPTFNPAASPPPPYPSFAPHPYPHPMHRDIVILPRDDEVEGKERLPAYTNSIYLKAIMPRKVEFTKPGVQARDRKWRRVMCVLEGTAFKVYRCPASVAGVGVIGDWWERKVGVGDVSLGTGTPPSGSHSHNSGSGARVQAVSRAEPSSFTKAAAEDIKSPPTQPEPSSATSQHTHSSPTTPTGNTNPQPQSTASRSRLNLAVNLLKPNRPHGRTHSDTSHLPKPRSSTSPRSSLSIPRPSFSSGSSDSRSASGSANSNSHSSSTAESHSSSDVGIPSSHPSSTSIPQAYPASSHIRANTAALIKGTDLPDPDPSDLIRAYTLQHAESGLGNDYLKRKNVIRVRMEGEQFLLQAKDVVDVVEWIEGFQAATNIALDLDERVMPKGPLFPRRRRRRGGRASRPTTAVGTGITTAPFNSNTNAAT